ncbi:hypothetical protein [Lactobacillus gallinarum]|uniref:Uncharacterized protein n=1 Tax=Lactobacillus gallinarum DSM 10532 = JCM 2011 TaxID=1423748 RepID=A0A0R1NUA3_9LACO|nr:hypothetical protein [Lactobacillus gallinarum]KRL23681.1 hypothetical protein FC37_GL000852 [Lactobacillus gallinarum DSM 10532 = JCM 2011]
MDAWGYNLTTLDGVPCLVGASGAIAGVYFKTPAQAEHFTQKYKDNEEKANKKLMD